MIGMIWPHLGRCARARRRPRSASRAIAAAQTYPSRPIRLIVTFPPGGSTDTMARALQPSLEKSLGQPIVIENRGGAGGAIGVDAIVKSAPDGYVFGIAGLGALAVDVILNDKLPYDPFRDIAPISGLIQSPFILAAPLAFSGNSIADVIALAKAKPGCLVDRPRRQRHRHAAHGAAVQPHDRARAAAGALSRHRAGHPGRARRPHSARHHRSAERAGADRGQAHQGAGDLQPRALLRLARRADLRRVRPAGLRVRSAGSASSRRPARRPPSSPGSTARSSRRSPIRPCSSASTCSAPSRCRARPEEFGRFIRSEYEKWGKVIAESGAKGR